VTAGCGWLPPPAPPQPSPPGASGTYAYECPDGYRFGLRVHGDSATLSLPDRTVQLQQVEVASGTRYGGDGVPLWRRGTEAMLRMHLQTFQGCRGGAWVRRGAARRATPWGGSRGERRVPAEFAELMAGSREEFSRRFEGSAEAVPLLEEEGAVLLVEVAM